MTSAAETDAWLPEFTIADRLRKIRRDVHLTQDDFAALLEVKPERYGAWETGRNKPEDPVALAQLIESKIGVPAWWTLGIHNINPGSGGPSGGLSRVRHQGLEPRTRWFSAPGSARVVRHPRFRGAFEVADAA